MERFSVRECDYSNIFVQFHYINPMPDLTIRLYLDADWLVNGKFTPLAS